MLTSAPGNDSSSNIESTQQLQSALGSIVTLFKEQKERQKSKVEKMIMLMADKDAKIKRLETENQELSEKLQRLSEFRKSMFNLLQSTEGALTDRSRQSSSKAHVNSIDTDRESIISDGTAKEVQFRSPAAHSDSNSHLRASSSTTAPGYQGGNASSALKKLEKHLGGVPKKRTTNNHAVSQPSFPFSYQRDPLTANRDSNDINLPVRPPTMLETALNESFFEQVKVQQQIVSRDSDQLEDTPDITREATAFQESIMMTIELLEPPSLTMDDITEEKIDSGGGIDPASLYRQIRDCVSPKSFEKFALAIGKFNDGCLASDCIREIEELIPESNLANQMSRLILEATQV